MRTSVKHKVHRLYQNYPVIPRGVLHAAVSQDVLTALRTGLRPQVNYPRVHGVWEPMWLSINTIERDILQGVDKV